MRRLCIIPIVLPYYILYETLIFQKFPCSMYPNIKRIRKPHDIMLYYTTSSNYIMYYLAYFQLDMVWQIANQVAENGCLKNPNRTSVSGGELPPEARPTNPPPNQPPGRRIVTAAACLTTCQIHSVVYVKLRLIFKKITISINDLFTVENAIIDPV